MEAESIVHPQLMIKGLTFVKIIDGEFSGKYGFNVNENPVKTAFVEVFDGPKYIPTRNWQHLPLSCVRPITKEEREEIFRAG